MTLAAKQILVGLAFGAVIGAVGAHWIVPCYFHRQWTPGKFQARMLERLNSKLSLTPEQRTQVAAILDGKREKIQALRAQIRPQFKEIRASTSAEIRRILTPEQQKKFDVMNAKWEEKVKRRFGWNRNWKGKEEET